MNSSQIADDMERWTELFFIMCEGEAPHNKAHWNLRLALSTFAKDVGGFTRQQNEEARVLITKFEKFIAKKDYESAKKMQGDLFYFILAIAEEKAH